MKKLCFLFFCLCLVQGSVSAQGFNPAQSPNPRVQEYVSDTSDAYYDDTVVPEYGSEESPAFLNRENMNPNEDSYGYGGADGVGSDAYDDDPYENE